MVIYHVTWLFTARDRRVIRHHATHILNMTQRESRKFAKDVLCSQVLIYWDTLRYVFYPESISLEGLEDFNRAFEPIRISPQGYVVITGHLGAWELAGHFCVKAAARPLHVLAKPSKTKWVNPILDKLRQMLSMKVLWIDSKSLFRDMLQLLSAGEGVGFVMDQRPAFKQGGHLVSFMGVADTPIVTGPSVVITKKNLPALGAYCVRVGPSRYRLVANTILVRDHGVTAGEDVSRQLAEDMESMIRQYPEQWAWNYRRWKHHLQFSEPG